MNKSYFLILIFLLLFVFVGCQREYFEEYEDRPTETIHFDELEVSKDTVFMFDTVVVRAIASGEDLHYKWQKNKGSLVPKQDDESVAYFWGCTTCTGWLTISCTVYNEYGAYTKEVEVYVLREWKR